jgi:hypothetical protein
MIIWYSDHAVGVPEHRVSPICTLISAILGDILSILHCDLFSLGGRQLDS